MWLGVDTGGTFTDFVLFDGEKVRTHKVLSTPSSPELAILQGMEELGVLNKLSLTMVHGSTVATNAVLEGKGVRTVYIANSGLADVIRIGRQARPSLYDLQPEPVNYLIEAEYCLEVNSRLAADGSELQTVSDEELEHLKEQIDAIKPEAVAINLLFSYLDASEEIRIEEALSADYFVSRSSAVLNEYREYERGMATCLNSYVGPLMKKYLSRLKSALPDVSLSIMQSNAGTISVEQAGNHAVNLLLSGPAGGLKGAQFVASNHGERALLSFDMGGTSTDVALIQQDIELTSEGKIADYPGAVPMVDMHTIGAGGGSIARVDEAGMLLVGPESAGADPGPACYGKGGSYATVTDANVVLGRIPSGQSLGGYLELDKQAASHVIEKIAAQLNVSAEDAAMGIVNMANEHMVQALRVISIQRGHDPKDFTLVSFGGAGGLHICELAESLSMKQAMVPVHGGVLSALGMLVATPSREMSHTLNRLFSECDNASVQQVMEALIRKGSRLMENELAGKQPEVNCHVDVCYRGQSFYLSVNWSDLHQVEKDFHSLHESRYGHRMDHELELVNVRVTLKAGESNFTLPEKNSAHATPVAYEQLTGEEQGVAVFQREQLGKAQVIDGPALILEKVASSYLKTGWQLEVDQLGNMLFSSV